MCGEDDHQVRSQTRRMIYLSLVIAVSAISITSAQQAQTEQCPDLLVSGSIALQPTDGLSAAVAATVHNIGQGSVESPFMVSLVDFACCHWEPGTQHVWLSESQLNELNATGSVTVLFPEVTFPSDISPCFSCRGVFVVDTEDDVDESCYPAPRGESNNAGCPDLVIDVTKAICECRGCEPIPETKCVRWGIRPSMSPLAPWSERDFYCLEWASVMAPPRPTCNVELEYAVRNIGTQHTGPFTVEVQGADNCVQQTPIPAGLAGGEKSVQSLSCALHPDWSSVPSAALAIVADSNNEIVNERAPENNTVSVPLNCGCEDEDDYYLALPMTTDCGAVSPETYVDLAVSGAARCVCTPALPGLPQDGSRCQISIDATVTATGTGEAQSPLLIGLSDVICDQPLGLAGERQLTAAETAELNEHGSVVLVDAFSWVVPSVQNENPCCSYTLTVDSLEATLECPVGAEENNTYTTTFCCEPLPGRPDIVIEGVRHSCNCETTPITERQCLEWKTAAYPPFCLRWGDVIVGYETACGGRIYYKVKNLGTGATGAFRVGMQTSRGYEESAHIGSLAAGEETMRWFDFAVGGVHTLTVSLIADDCGVVEECDEENNTAEVTVRCQ